MTASLKIDFASDVSCPWCAIGLFALETAIQAVQGDIRVHLQVQPFELNPDMVPEGQEVNEHLLKKYGGTPEQLLQVREVIRARGAEVGFAFHPEGRGRIWNTFNAHRLLHWAGVEGRPGQQQALKKALLTAYHGRAESPADPAVLLAAAVAVGLDRARAQAVIAGREYAEQVRERERFFVDNGVHSVPALIINDHHLLLGGHPAAVFEKAFRDIASRG